LIPVILPTHRETKRNVSQSSLLPFSVKPSFDPRRRPRPHPLFDRDDDENDDDDDDDDAKKTMTVLHPRVVRIHHRRPNEMK